MSRKMKNGRGLQQHRRNDGPEMLSRAADDKLKDSVKEVVEALFDASVNHHDPAAANALVDLAESAEYAERAALLRRVNSLAERWAKEPEVVTLVTAPQLDDGVHPKLLTSGDGKPAGGEEVLDAEFE